MVSHIVRPKQSAFQKLLSALTLVHLFFCPNHIRQWLGIPLRTASLQLSSDHFPVALRGYATDECQSNTKECPHQTPTDID